MFAVVRKLSNLNLSAHRVVSCRSLITSPCSQKATFEEKLGIQPKPKRPMTAFLKFSSSIVRPSVLKENPNTPVTQITKIAAERWKSVDSDIKKQLTDEFKLEMEKYRQAMSEYEKALSKVEIGLIEKYESNEQQQKKAFKRRRLALGCPKQPKPAYIFYHQERRSEQGNIPYKEWVVKVAEDWKNLDEESKLKYFRLHENEKNIYAEKKAIWEREMKASGHEDVLSKKAKSPKK